VQGSEVLHGGPPINDVTPTGCCRAAVDAALAVIERAMAFGTATAP